MADRAIFHTQQGGRAAKLIVGSFWTASFLIIAALLAAGPAGIAQQKPRGKSDSCAADNGGITLSPGFCATVFADNLGHARQMAFGPNGVLYVNTWTGWSGQPPAGGFLVALKDTRGDGHAILSGLPLTGDHPMHPFIIDGEGHMFVDLGSATNSCQLQNRIAYSPSHQPCTELETRAGIWLYDANKKDQRFSPSERYATGLRNGEGFAFDTAGRLFVTQHGRDQLSQNWPSLFTSEQNAELPAEEIVQLEKGADYGWPECYYDGLQNKLVLAPEYGGDGKKVGVCASKKAPVASLPGHWAPNDLLIYCGNAFPAAYQGGAFVAFHGSSDRAPEPQGGYNVVFQPLADGKAAGAYIVFVDGFAGAVKQPGRASFRPSGLAMGSDGALYISEDVHGRIWRVTYHGDPDATLAPAPSP